MKTTTKQIKTITNIINATFALCAFACFALVPTAHGVSPAPDGCYPGFTTAEGCKALQFLGAGAGNTGVGWYSLYSVGGGSYNTGVGAGALVLNTADSNTAVGTVALLLNTTGFENTAVGTDALVYNDTGSDNTANGAFALFSNTTGAGNTAVGSYALYSNTTGGEIGTGSVAIGYDALSSNVSGERNTAIGVGAMSVGTTGSRNTATGRTALNFNTGDRNTADGHDALYTNTTGSDNIALGNFAGFNLTTGNNNIDIGNLGVADESNTIRIGDPAVQTATFIAGISGTAVVGDAVVVDANGQLGTVASSARFKREIKPMDKVSEAILALKPVSFQYKSDAKAIPQFGLIAEEVAKVNPDLVVRDRKGEIYSVRYEAVNAMLLNEFLKAHRKVEELEARVAQQQKDFQTAIVQQQKDFTARLKEQDAKIRKVSDKIELSKPAPQTVLNH
jgi:trimeric autotransporter adhesin